MIVHCKNMYDVHLRGLFQNVVDFLCYKKTIQCIAIDFFVNSSIISSLSCKKLKEKYLILKFVHSFYQL